MLFQRCNCFDNQRGSADFMVEARKEKQANLKKKKEEKEKRRKKAHENTHKNKMSTTTATAAKGRLNKEVTFFFLYRHCDGAFPNGTSFLFLFFVFFSLLFLFERWRPKRSHENNNNNNKCARLDVGADRRYDDLLKKREK